MTQKLSKSRLGSWMGILATVFTIGVFSTNANAQTIGAKTTAQGPTPGDNWSMRIKGTRTMPATPYSTNTQTIWDDGGWNCNNAFLIRSYIGDIVTLEYYGPAGQPCTAAYENRYEIREWFTGAPIASGYVPNSGGSFAPGTATMYFSPPTKGFYGIKFFNNLQA